MVKLHRRSFSLISFLCPLIERLSFVQRDRRRQSRKRERERKRIAELNPRKRINRLLRSHLVLDKRLLFFPATPSLLASPTIPTPLSDFSLRSRSARILFEMDFFVSFATGFSRFSIRFLSSFLSF